MITEHINIEETEEKTTFQINKYRKHYHCFTYCLIFLSQNHTFAMDFSSNVFSSFRNKILLFVALQLKTNVNGYDP